MLLILLISGVFITAGITLKKSICKGRKLVCWYCVKDINTGYTELSCGHHFHDYCIIPYIVKKRNCPICDASL